MVKFLSDIRSIPLGGDDFGIAAEGEDGREEVIGGAKAVFKDGVFRR